MNSTLIAFMTSFICTFLLLRYQHLHDHLSGDEDLIGPQKVHINIVPRIGGISIAAGLLSTYSLRLNDPLFKDIIIQLILCATPVFLIGLAEDLTNKVSIKVRLFFTALSSLIFIYTFKSQITTIGFPMADFLLKAPVVAGFFTIFAVSGLSNSYNIIDGFNGLSSMVGALTLLGLGYIGILIGDPVISNPSFIMVGAILGFFVWNYPKGLIFLGDGGAYLIGFWIAILSILTVNRHPDISPWFAILINGYPIFETLFTIYRRKIHQGKSPGQPDGMHFHSLLFRRVLNKKSHGASSLSANAKTAPFFWILSCSTIIPALIWRNSTIHLITALCIFICIYIFLYSRVVRFKTPKWFPPFI